MKRSALWLPMLEILAAQQESLDLPAFSRKLAAHLEIADLDAFEATSGTGREAFLKLIGWASLDLAATGLVASRGDDDELLTITAEGREMLARDDAFIEIRQRRVERLNDATLRRFSDGGWQRACRLI